MAAIPGDNRGEEPQADDRRGRPFQATPQQPAAHAGARYHVRAWRSATGCFIATRTGKKSRSWISSAATGRCYWGTLTPRSFAKRSDCCPRVGRCTRRASHQEYSGRLASALSQRAGGDYCAVFANSGTEAVEIAIKHAIHETGSRTFVALEGAFHGQTLGALQLTADPQFRDEFELSGLRVIRVALNDIDQLERAFADAPPLAGFIFEPIQGEGGVRPVTPAFARRAAQLCAERNTPLIADECQTGVGRTGDVSRLRTVGR